MSDHVRVDGGWAIVGLGRIARAHLDALATWEHSPVVAAVEPLASQAARYNLAPVFSSVAGLLAERKLEAAIVCAPPGSHLEICMALLDAGVHMLVEKPVATSAVDGWTLVRAAQERGLVLQTAGKFREMPMLRRAKELIASGAIGDVVRLENVFAGPLDATSDWHATRAVSGGGVLMDNGPHSLDVATALLGDVASVRTELFESRQGTDVEDEVVFEARHVGGAVSRVHLSWNDAIKAPIARVVGTTGTLVLDWKTMRLERQDDVTEIDVDGGAGYDKVACFSSLLKRFAAAIDAAPVAGGEPRGAKALDVIEAIYRSARSKSWEDIQWESENPSHQSRATSTR
jgi:predicted dehydrogenase